MVQLGAAQVRIDIDDPDGTRDRVVAGVERAAAAGVEILVLPELTFSGYVFADAEEATRRAEGIDGPGVTLLRRMSAEHRLVLVAGFCERGADRAYNSAVVLDGGEVLTRYRKTHLWDHEVEVFAAGEEPPPVVSTSRGRIAPLICYDLEFPELVRRAALAGAQLIAVPANWPRLPVPPGERPVEVIKAQASAAVNRVAVVVADRCGVERGVSWIGGSLICGPDGYLRAGPVPGEEALLVAAVDLEACDDKRISAHNDVLADRRPEIY
jgi:predicted amidohydrolase